jgi:drug/metabolite transporter (DMT)-like permease
LAVAPFFWACNWIIGRGLHADIPPFAMTFYRWTFALAFMLPFALRHVRRQWPLIRANARVLALLGVLGVGSHNALAYIALNYTTATNGVILNSFIPVMIIALSWLFLRQRLSNLQLAGVVVSLAGVLTILSQGSVERLASFRLNPGDVVVMFSMLLWSLYTICLRWRPPGLHMLAFLFVIACVGDLAVLPFYLAEAAFIRTPQWSPQALAALAAIGLFSSFLAYIVWNRGVEQVGASVAGLFVHLMPVFGTVLAWFFLDERLRVYHLAGIALILTGIYVTSRAAAPPVPAAPE